MNLSQCLFVFISNDLISQLVFSGKNHTRSKLDTWEVGVWDRGIIYPYFCVSNQSI